MSEPDDANLDVLKAPLPPRADRDPVNQLRFQLLGYTTALALLITLVPTWLVRDHGRSLQLFTGFGMVRHADILGSAANLLFIAYLLLALVALATPTKLAAFVSAYAGLAVSIVIVLLKPESESYDEVWWTGAPVLAIGLWLILAVVNTIGWFITRRK